MPRARAGLNSFGPAPLQLCGRLEVQMTPAVVKRQSLGATMTREERSNLILTFARVLYINGGSTHQTLGAAERLSSCLGFRATIFPHWGELEVQAEDSDSKFISAIEAAPSGVDMDRVASTLRTVEELCDGRLAPGNATEAINRIAEAPPAPTWLFTLAAAVGAVSLAVLFGVQHVTAAALIFGSAAAGAILRRTLARYSTNIILQPFSAALVAAPCRGVPVHGARARPPFPQRHVGFDQRPHKSRHVPTSLCGAHRCGYLDGIAPWARILRRVLTCGTGREGGASLA